MGDHAVHVATALMGVRGGEQPTVLGPYPDSPQAELPGRSRDVLLEGDRDPLTEPRPHLLVVSQGLRDPWRDEDVEDHEAAHGVAGEAEERGPPPCPEEWRASGPEPHPPEGDLTLFLHDLANEVPLAHADASAGQDGVTVCKGVQRCPQLVKRVVGGLVPHGLATHGLDQRRERVGVRLVDLPRLQSQPRLDQLVARRQDGDPWPLNDSDGPMPHGPSQGYARR